MQSSDKNAIFPWTTGSVHAVIAQSICEQQQEKLMFIRTGSREIITASKKYIAPETRDKKDGRYHWLNR